MTVQLRYQNYVQNFQSALTALMATITPAPAPKVYNLWNPNSGVDTEFVVWALRNMHQDVYTGVQTNKGIDYPIFGINVYAKTNTRLITITDTIITAWHGFFGNLNGISVGKSDVDLLLTYYDDESSVFASNLDMSLLVAVPTSPTLSKGRLS